MLMNAAADGLLQQEDVNELWTWACQALAEDDGSVHALRLRDMQLSARCEAISAGSEVIGALIRVGTSATAARSVQRRHDPKRSRASLGWERLRESELSIAQLVTKGLTNREIGARLFMSRHTVDSYMRQIFRKLGIASRVELTRVVVERAGA
jgi:DNA-binding NarL/FixJ family response regulator